MKKTLFSPLGIGGIGVIAVVLAASAFGLRATSTTAFCLSCHEMTPYRKELALSSHARDKDGKDIGCSQCHLPLGVGPRYLAVKAWSGVKDLALHVWENPVRIDRLASQAVARRFLDDANCLACHTLDHTADGQAPVSPIGRVAHDAYLGKNGTTRRGCAGCHVNLAHLPEFDKRLPGNKDFAEKLSQEASR
ncbi:MAG: NapC/NirT family cytochrome c [Desulfovibrio sp.]|jgi:nitrate/TMAO reductase-like tetraheme cytochrome c subunit|nr:NapC/NirT family cytochrome c [Desulfovibrio sp.]